MTNKLSDTQAQILTAAAQHDAHLAQAPEGLPAAARNAVFRSMLKNGLLEELPTQTEYRGLTWRREEDETPVALRITGVGLQAIGAEPKVERPTVDGEASLASAARSPLRGAAAAVLAAWDAAGSGHAGMPLAGDLGEPMERLRSVLTAQRAAGPRSRVAGAARSPREGTKQQAVLALLRRSEGTTVAQVMQATGWAQHTVRGFLAGLKKKDHKVEVLERVRQVGPGAQGAKGSYSIYRIATEEQG
jgi:hypothetical protein